MTRLSFNRWSNEPMADYLTCFSRGRPGWGLRCHWAPLLSLRRPWVDRLEGGPTYAGANST